MKKLFAYFTIAALSLGMWSCGEPKEEGEPQLPVTSANINGVWKLDQWQGTAVAEDMIVYIDFESIGNTYTIYQNVDSSVIDEITGTYTLYTNPSGKSILRGIYDYSDDTEWSHRYVVSSLTSTKMTLQVYDEPNNNDISVYVRAELPEMK